MPIHQVLRLARGAITELDSSEEDKVRNLANSMPVAKGPGGRQRQPHAGRPTRLEASIGLVRAQAICYIRARATLGRIHPHAVVAELVDALA
jgi:hypothetical protein